ELQHSVQGRTSAPQYRGRTLAVALPTARDGFSTGFGAGSAAAKGLLQQARSQIALFLERREWRDERQRLEFRLTAREYETATFIHEVNNLVQDITLMCDDSIEVCSQLPVGSVEDPLVGTTLQEFQRRLRKVQALAEQIAITGSDLNRKQELKRNEETAARDTVSFRDVIREVLSFAKVRAERRRIEIVYDSLGIDDQDVWVSVSAREQLLTVLRHLFVAAIRASKPGSSIAVTTGRSDGCAECRIQDSGSGLSKSELASVLEETSEAIAPSGYSDPFLPVCRRYLQSNGGSLELTSAGAGMGVLWRVELPIQTSVVATPRPLATGVGAGWALVVEDETLLAGFYARVLRALGLETVVCETTAEAEAVLGKRTSPTLVVTDLTVGSGGGVRWIETLGELISEDVPVLVISGEDDRQTVESVLAAGADQFLVKPVGQRILYQTAEELVVLGRKGGTQHESST
ncbi:MAG: hybrid sensor histidine kinase/response regulator, partial [Bdellovibrionales bacterium]|nr:hybrid sensor histidine kinase/response regulator [Bdellovibrionales bacterium]